MKINILICTYNDGINKVPDVLMPYHPDVSYKVSHQVDGAKVYDVPEELMLRDDVELRRIRGRGLCINRNNSLAMADGDICFIADDDVKYDLKHVFKAAGLLYEERDCSILCGQITTPTGDPDFKKYPAKTTKIDWFNIGHISSIEMVLKRLDIQNVGLNFDPCFGIGGKICNKGEEAVFLSDALKRGLSIKYYPIPVVTHPYESSGNNIRYDEKEAKFYGTLFYRIFGSISYIMSMPLSILHRSRYKKIISWNKFLRAYIRGVTAYRVLVHKKTQND